MDNIPSEVAVFPRMSSPFTRINYGMCATSEWHNVFGLVENGKKAVFRTNRMIEPWKLGSEAQKFQNMISSMHGLYP